jgi:hypothetical protein
MNLSENTRTKLALAIAMTADFLQIALFPMLGEGIFSPFNDLLDVAVGGALWALLGWHYSFLPALLAEAIPGLDLVPTWTAAAYLAMKKKKDVPVTPATVIDV